MDNYGVMMDTGDPVHDYQQLASFQQFASDTASYSSMTIDSAYAATNNSNTAEMQHGFSPPHSQQNYSIQSNNPQFAMPFDSSIGRNSQMQISNTHSSTKPIHSCSFCGLVLSSANALVEHKRTHTGERPFACTICNKRFTQKAHLNIHKRTHTGEKPYACHICHKRFAQSSHLSSHTRIHTGEKPFVCGICNIGFTQKQRLDAHLKKHIEHPEGITSNRGIKPDRREIKPVVKIEDVQNSSQLYNAALCGQPVGQEIPYVKKEVESGDDNDNINLVQEIPGTKVRIDNNNLHLPIEDMSNRTKESIGQSNKSHSFSSEGMFLHPSGYVAYGGVEGSEDSEQNNPSVENGSSSSLLSNTSTSSGHRRKPSIVRKRYSESPIKDKSDPSDDSIDSFIPQDLSIFHPLKSEPTDNSIIDLQKTCTDFNNTEELQQNRKNSFYEEDSISKLTPNKESNYSTEAHREYVSSTEPRCQSRNSYGQILNHGNQYEDKTNSAGKITFSGNANITSSSFVKHNNRISLVNFTADELISHIMKRDDIHKCEFCCLVFQDAAMYHIHRNMHDKQDIRKCNMCGKLLQDKYDFTAHFLSMHQS